MYWRTRGEASRASPRLGTCRGAGGLQDDCGDRFGYLVGQEEDLAGDCHEPGVRARLERPPLLLRQPAVALLGMDDPGRNVGLAQPVGASVPPLQPPQVLAQRRLHVARDVPAEVLA